MPFMSAYKSKINYGTGIEGMGQPHRCPYDQKLRNKWAKWTSFSSSFGQNRKIENKYS